MFFKRTNQCAFLPPTTFLSMGGLFITHLSSFAVSDPMGHIRDCLQTEETKCDEIFSRSVQIHHDKRCDGARIQRVVS